MKELKTCVILRTNKIDKEVNSKYEYLSNHLHHNVYIIVEQFSNENLYIEKDENTIYVGRKFLINNQLSYFPLCGWQCGDYILYAAYEILSQYDFYWLVEPDLYFLVDIISYFKKIDLLNDDLLGPNLGIRSENWMWSQYAKIINQNVYGLQFPFLRISNSAIAYCLEQRKEYCSRPEIKKLDFFSKQILPFCNDESFLATTLVNNKLFKCNSLNKKSFFELETYFSVNYPILKEEINSSYLQNKIIHPLLDSDDDINKIRKKFRTMSKIKSGLLIYRMEQILDCISKKKFESLTNISINEIRYLFLTENIKPIDYSFMRFFHFHKIKKLLYDYFFLAKLTNTLESEYLLNLYHFSLTILSPLEKKDIISTIELTKNTTYTCSIFLMDFHGQLLSYDRLEEKILTCPTNILDPNIKYLQLDLNNMKLSYMVQDKIIFIDEQKSANNKAIFDLTVHKLGNKFYVKKADKYITSNPDGLISLKANEIKDWELFSIYLSENNHYL